MIASPNLPFPKIAIVATYFGRLPAYFGLWLSSCAANPDFDWHVFTDDDSGIEAPANVHLRKMSLQQFKNLMAGALGIKVAFDRPYKVCDFRPAYWALLDQEQVAYDYWGHCDLDMIFGDLRQFITRAILDHDKIFSVGHLTLYRNCSLSNTMFMRSLPGLEWKQILSDPQHRGFDEHIGVNRIWKQYGGRVYEDERLVADIDPGVASFVLPPPHLNARLQVFFFENGRVFRGYYSGAKWRTEEFMYIHFQKRSFPPRPLPQGGSLYITPNGFIPKQTPIPTPEEVRLLNSPPDAWNLAATSYRARRWLRYFRRVWGSA